MMAYKYLVYRLYTLASGLEYDNTPKYTALFSVSALILLNFAAMDNFVGQFDITLPFFQTHLSSVIIAIVILIINIIIVNKIGIDNMGKQFLKTNEKRNDIFVVIYILGSIAFYFVSFSWIKVKQDI